MIAKAAFPKLNLGDGINVLVGGKTGVWLLEDPLTIAAIGKSTTESGLSLAHLALWDVMEGHLRYERTMEHQVWDAGFSQSLRAFCVGSNSSPDFHSLATSPEAAIFETQLDSFRLHENRGVHIPSVFGFFPVYGVAYVAVDSTGKRAAIATWDRKIHIFQLDTLQKSPLIFRGHETVVSALAFSPNGETLASMDRSGVLRLWNTETLAAPVNATKSQGWAAPVQVGGSPPVVLCNQSLQGSRPTELLSVVRASPRNVLTMHVQSRAEAHLTPDGATVLVVEDRKIIALASQTLKEQWVYSGDSEMGALTTSRNSKWLAVRFYRENEKREGFLLLELSTGRETANVIFSNESDRLLREDRSHAFNQSGSHFAITRGTSGPLDVYTVDKNEGSVELHFQCPGLAPIQFLNETVLLSGYVGRSWVERIDIGSRSSFPFPSNYIDKDVVISPDGHWGLQTGMDCGPPIYVIDMHSGKVVAEIQAEGVHLESSAFSPDGRLLAIRGARGIELWRPSNGTHLCTFPSDSTPLNFSADGRYLTAVSPGGLIEVSDILTSGNHR
jgi:WD40 repeat protein